MELVEDIPSQYKIGNRGGDHFDSIDRHLMDSEIDPIGANCSATSAGMTVMAAPLSTRAGQRSETRVL